MKNYKKLTTFMIIISIFCCVFFQSVAYSAFESNFKVTGDAYTRVEADVRITDFRLGTTNNATSSYEEFSKDYIVTEVDLVDSSSYITYYLEITNYGSVDVGIFDITGLPSGVNYSIKDYNLKDKICDDNGKCNSFITKTYEITLTVDSTYAGNIQMNFDFRTYHTVTYTDITNNNYPTEVIDGGDLNITFTEDLKRILVLSDGTEVNYYSTISSGQTITIENVLNDIELKVKEQVARLVSGEIDTVGSEVCIKDECFYVISNDGSTVTMLSKYNLYVGGIRKDGVWTAYGDEATGIQNSTMLGLISGQSVRNGITVFSSTNYWSSTTSSYLAYVYDENSILYTYIENYKIYLENQGTTIAEARLITLEELETLECSSSGYSCSSAPEWVYSTTYWSGVAYNSTHVKYVRSDGRFGNDVYSNDDSYGVRPVIEINVDEILVPVASVEVVSGDVNTVGSEVSIGDEHFYIISSDTDSVTMLAKYNLYTGGVYNSSWTSYGEEATRIQDSTMLGWCASGQPYNGTLAFSSTNYWSSTVSSYPTYVYDSNSKLYTPIENYKTYLESQGVAVEEARLIKIEELETLGCSRDDNSCSEAPEWVYSTTYWSGSASDSSYVWGMYSDGEFDIYHYSYSNHFGARPVITISKDYF